MKKIVFYSIVLCFQYISLAYGWEVRVLPVSRDPMTGQWNALFGHDVAGEWSDFKIEGTKEKKASFYAAQALEKQTHGAYRLSAKDIESSKASIRLANGDFLYAVPVNYISDPNLHKMMHRSVQRDLTKDFFVWLPMEELLQHRTVVKLFRGKEVYKVDQKFRSLMLQHWNKELAPALNARSDAKRFNIRETNNRLTRYIDGKPVPVLNQKITQARIIRTRLGVTPKQKTHNKIVAQSGRKVAKREYV